MRSSTILSAATAAAAVTQALSARSTYSEDWIAIHQTLNTYPLAIDSKDFGLLSQVFTANVIADYGAGVGVLNGLEAVESGLQQSLTPVLTQHALSTNVIDVHTGASTANSTTYYTASHFGQGAYEGQVLYAYGKYVDDLVKLGHEVWRIQNRTLLYMGPYIGNLSVFLS